MDLSKFDKSCPKVTDFAMAMDSYKVVTGDMVNVWITSNITSFTSQKKMDKQGYLFVIFLSFSGQLKIRSEQLKIRNFH